MKSTDQTPYRNNKRTTIEDTMTWVANRKRLIKALCAKNDYPSTQMFRTHSEPNKQDHPFLAKRIETNGGQ